MIKHAYLIMAHGQFGQLKRLLRCLDDYRNDIFLHIDAKSEIIPIEELHAVVNRASLIMVKRMNVIWGHESQIECEMNLIQAAVENDNEYSYLHLLSGNDLPIKSQNYIHSFFEKNKGKEFVHFETGCISGIDREKVDFFYPLQKYVGSKSHTLLYYLERAIVHAQRVLKVQRRKDSGIIFAKGANWFSITDEFAKHLLSCADQFKQLYCKTLCCDEIFLQTCLLNSRFVENLYYKGFDDNYEGNMRLIVWEGKGVQAHPHLFKNEDMDFLNRSDRLFARKFDESFSDVILQKLIGE